MQRRSYVSGSLALALASAAGGAEIFLNVEYVSPGVRASCPNDTPCNRLDVYLPEKGVGPGVPTVVYIHGGGWRSGDKSSFSSAMIALAEIGYPGISCNYTLSTPDEPSYPQAVFDVKAVVRWVRTVGRAEYGLSSTIVVTGSSAGGHLTMMLGTTAGVAAFEPLPPPPGREGYRPNAIFPLWGISDFTAHEGLGRHPAVEQFFGVPWSDPPPPVYSEGSPITYAYAAHAPAAFYHGQKDATVPWEQSQIMHDRLVALDVYSEIHLDPDAGHGFGAWGGTIAMALQIAERIPDLLAADRDPADLDKDGMVGLGDLLLLLSSWGACPESPEACRGDLDRNGTIDFGDLTRVLARWG